MMNHSLRTNFLFQISALMLAVIVVHAAYVTVIRPNAEAIQARQFQNENYAPSRSIYIILKDYEQEATFILLLWAMGIMGIKVYHARRGRALLETDLIVIDEGTSLLPEDTRRIGRSLEALTEEMRQQLPVKSLLTALQRFGTTRNLQNAAEAVKSLCEQEADRLESELAMVRYIAWAIPSIGFIGTVRGIGAALGEAHRAVEGDIAGVTANLGVAFNSTFVALVLSIVLMFLLHQLQSAQERLVLDSQDYVDKKLLRYMQVR